MLPAFLYPFGGLPLGVLSYIVGKFVAVRLPSALNFFILQQFCSAYQVKVEEAQFSLEQYRSLADFFVRDLKSELRPQQGGITSPVDGCLRNFGSIEDHKIPQVKGITYTVEALLEDRALADRFATGSFVNLYLSPPDYHHVHMPLSAELVSMRYVPGRFWPVNDWALRSIPGLFCMNERVILEFQSHVGRLVLVMVGALNVAKISLPIDAFSSRTQLATGVPVVRSYNPARSVPKGTRVGTFHLGSTVVLLFESTLDKLGQITVQEGAKVRVGQTLLAER